MITNKQVYLKAFDNLKNDPSFKIIVECINNERNNLINNAMAISDPVYQAHLVTKASALDSIIPQDNRGK